MVARLAPSRFAVICPEAPQGSIETLAHAIEHRLEERRLRCWAGFGERNETDERPADLVARGRGGAGPGARCPLEDLQEPLRRAPTDGAFPRRAAARPPPERRP